MNALNSLLTLCCPHWDIKLIPLLPHINQLVAWPYFRPCQTVAGFENFLTVAALTRHPDDAAIADGAAFLVADGAVDAEAALRDQGREAEGDVAFPGRGGAGEQDGRFKPAQAFLCHVGGFHLDPAAAAAILNLGDLQQHNRRQVAAPGRGGEDPGAVVAEHDLAAILSRCQAVSEGG